MTRAIPWDGVGPKRECLLRVRWADGGAEEWVHFDWRDADADGYDDGESTEFSCNPDEYFNDASGITICVDEYTGTFSQITGADFTILYYADLPVIARVIVLGDVLGDAL